MLSVTEPWDNCYMEGAALGNWSINSLNTALLAYKCHNYLEQDVNKMTI